MKTRVAIIITILVLFGKVVSGQNYSPLDLAKNIFAKDSFPNIENYITGEYEGKPNGQDLRRESTTNFILLGQTEGTAVVAMTILDSLGNGFDTYLHFEKDTVWKMCAFRALAMTGIIEQVLVELEKMTPQQVDSIITESRNKNKSKAAIFSSKEEYDFLLGNSKLTLELDKNIKKHFLENQSEFEKLKNYALKQIENQNIDEERSIKLIEDLKANYERLFISSVSTGGYELGNCINFLIGGILDNSVGYIYVKDKKDLPEMNSDRIIMLREIGNGWYIYKTT